MKKLFSSLICFLAVMALKAQTLETVKYKDGDQALNGMVTAHTGKMMPGVLILPAWMGIDNEAKATAEKLEKAGYIAFIADIYGEGHQPTDYASAGKMARQYIRDYKSYQHRISLALEQLKKAGADPNKIAVIGFCFGGTGALETARANFPVRGVVSIHGGLAKDKDRANDPIKTEVLVENGADDPGVTPEVVAALTTELNLGKTDWQMITYAKSKHTFTNPESKDYNQKMAQRAWAHTMMFLNEILK